MNNAQGRFSRSMQEGINPYAAGPVHPMPGGETRGDVIKGALLAVFIGLALVAAATQWWTA